MRYQPISRRNSLGAGSASRQEQGPRSSRTSAVLLLLAVLCGGNECRAQGTGAVSIWYLGNQLSVTSTANLADITWWHVAGVGDFNGDGTPDLVFQNPLTGESQIWFMGGAGGSTVTGAAGLSGA